jgi:hypothetical protein
MAASISRSSKSAKARKNMQAGHKTAIPFAVSDLALLAKLTSDHSVAELPQINR